MTYEEALDIINNDPDWNSIKTWRKKHFKAYDLYLKNYIGFSSFWYRRKIIKSLKKAQKEVKNK